MYKPIKILNKNSMNKDFLYEEHLPSKELYEYVACYWVLKNKNFLSNNVNYMMLPDGCVDVLFDLESNISILLGTLTQSRTVSLAGKIKNIGIRFLPKAIPYILKEDANELNNITIETDIISKELSQMLFKIKDIKNKDQIYEMINVELINYFSKYVINKRFNKILDFCINKKGILKVSDIAGKYGISERQVSRYFNKNIGVSTKEFLSVLRFQNMIGVIEKGVNISNKYFDLGFYDQSHMIKELKKNMNDKNILIH